MKRFLFMLILCLSCYGKAMAVLNPVVDSIPMRDGKKLAADVYIPAGCSSCPTILVQTPYGRLPFRFGLPMGIGQNLNSSDYIFVVVDWRGFYGSSSAAVASPNRGEDGYDCIEWIVNQTWSNGLVGTWGPSALGKIQFETAREQHPAHVCAVPLVASPEFMYQDYFPGGVYRTEYVEQLDALGYGLSAGLLANPFYNITWLFAENNSQFADEINTPMMMIGGWYDHGPDGMIDHFLALRSTSPIAVRDKHRLIMGPWAHGGNGTAHVGDANQGDLFYPEAEGWSDSLALLFFDHYLLGQNNGIDATSYITYFQMGENNWNTTAVWPPSDVSALRLYLQNDHSLISGLPQNTSGNSSFVFDPHNPSPTYGGATLRQDLLQGPYDQTDSVESRSDLLIFETPVLGQDVVMKGKVKVHLWVSSDRTDTDFAIRLTDVYPDGRSMLLGDGIRRMRFRDGYATGDTASMVPGTLYEVDIEMQTSCITFLTGHRIRLDISSANYPRYDLNLNNGGVMYTAGDTLVANNTVYHSSVNASYVELQLQDFIGGVGSVDELSLKVFPNPSSDQLMVSTNLGNSGQWTIYDYTGRSIDQNFFSASTFSINVSGYAPGIYFLTLEQNQHRITQTIVIR
jgi:predicted acyl esterase